MGRKRQDAFAATGNAPGAAQQPTLPMSSPIMTGAAHPAQPEAQQPQQQPSGEQPQEQQPEDGKPKNKAQAVRIILGESPDMSPIDACKAIKDRFGFDMEPQHFSSYKSQERAKAEKGGTDGRSSRQSSPQKTGGGLREMVGAAKEVKKCLDTHGAEAVNDVLALAKKYDADTLEELVGFLNLLSGE